MLKLKIFLICFGLFMFLGLLELIYLKYKIYKNCKAMTKVIKKAELDYKYYIHKYSSKSKKSKK